jgi:hypothetical protein
MLTRVREVGMRAGDDFTDIQIMTVITPGRSG